jgi:hypothetical protein
MLPVAGSVFKIHGDGSLFRQTSGDILVADRFCKKNIP